MANKCAIAARIDNFSDNPRDIWGVTMKKQVEEKINFYCGVVGEFKSNEEWMEEASKSYKLINKEKKKKKRDNSIDMDDISND